jgi:hypothetical protein
VHLVGLYAYCMNVGYFEAMCRIVCNTAGLVPSVCKTHYILRALVPLSRETRRGWVSNLTDLQNVAERLGREREYFKSNSFRSKLFCVIAHFRENGLRRSVAVNSPYTIR